MLWIFGSPALAKPTPGATFVKCQLKREPKRRSPHIEPKMVCVKNPDRGVLAFVWPVVKGLRDSAIRRRVQSLLSYSVLSGKKLKRSNQEFMLDLTADSDFQVTYDRGEIVSLRISLSHHGASVVEETWLAPIDLRRGKRLRAVDLFRKDQLKRLVKRCDQALQRVFQRRIQTYRTGDWGGDRPTARTVKEMFRIYAKSAVPHFSVANLDNFWISAKGITFDVGDYGFSRAERNYAPESTIFISHRTLAPFYTPRFSQLFAPAVRPQQPTKKRAQ